MIGTTHIKVGEHSLSFIVDPSFQDGVLMELFQEEGPYILPDDGFYLTNKTQNGGWVIAHKSGASDYLPHPEDSLQNIQPIQAAGPLTLNSLEAVLLFFLNLEEVA